MEDVIAWFVGRLLPVITVVVFIGGVCWRLRRWTTATRPRLTLFPAEQTSFAIWKEILKEVAGFGSIFSQDKSLWAGAWLFHASLAVVLLGHLNLTGEATLGVRLSESKGMNGTAMVNLIGQVAGLTALAAGLYLLARRVLIRTVRELSYAEDYLVLGLVLAVILTGDALRFCSPPDLTQVRMYLRNIVSLTPGIVPTNSWFLLHFFAAQVLIMMLPFSRLMHAPGVFFSKHLILKQ